MSVCITSTASRRRKHLNRKMVRQKFPKFFLLSSFPFFFSLSFLPFLSPTCLPPLIVPPFFFTSYFISLRVPCHGCHAPTLGKLVMSEYCQLWLVSFGDTVSNRHSDQLTCGVHSNVSNKITQQWPSAYAEIIGISGSRKISSKTWHDNNYWLNHKG